MRYRQYIRVSSKKQLRGASLEDQERANAGRVAQLGGAVEHTYIEAGRSAFTERLDKRPAFQQMLVDARARRFDALVVYDLSRFSRQAAASLTVAADLERLGITVISATEYFDRTTAAGRMTYTMLAAAAQFKSDHLSERMRAVRRSTAERGLLPGPVPVGYARVEGQLLPTPASEAVKLGFQFYSTGDVSAAQVTDAMNATGHTMPDGTPFKVTAVEELLKNPTYAGLIPCRDQLYEGQHEALISPELWQRVQDVALRRAKRRLSPHTHRYPLLAGLAVCAGCGAPCWASGGAEHPYYLCSAHTTRNHGVSPDVRCIGQKSPATQVEHGVYAWLVGLALAPGLLDDARRRIEQHAPPPPKPEASAEAALKKLKSDFLADRITAGEYEARRSELLKAPAMPVAAPAPVDTGAAFALLADLPTLLEQAAPDERRLIVRELLSEVWIKRGVVVALRPTRAAEALAAAARGCAAVYQLARSWAGWAYSPPPSHRVNDWAVWLHAA